MTFSRMQRLHHIARRMSTKVRTLETPVNPSTGLSRPRRVRVAEDNSLWESVIGLEVHAQVQCESKLFSGASCTALAPTNTSVSFFDAALPGTLPTLNREAVVAGIKTALALDSQINKVSYFDRKHYFYADLPTGYQITQQRQPLALGGSVDFIVLKSAKVPVSYRHQVSVTQIQLEHDSGKSLHDESTHGQSLIDLNRAGIGLMEIVFEPELFDGEEAAALVRELLLILEAVEACNCRMEEGALRVDANVSVRQVSDPSDFSPTPLGVRTEIKNLNSLRVLANAIEYEVSRQIRVLCGGGEIVNETRSFDVQSKATLPMRDKEVKQDYRFMPEPNLPPLRVCDDISAANQMTDPTSGNVLNVAFFRNLMPELPKRTRQNLVEKHKLTLENASILMNEPSWLEFFQCCLQFGPKNPNSVAIFILTEVIHYLEENNTDFEGTHLTPKMLVDLANMKEDKTLPVNFVRRAIKILLDEEYPSARALIKEKGWDSLSHKNQATINEAVLKVIRENPKLMKKCLKGKQTAIEHMMTLLRRSCSHELDMELVRNTFLKILKEQVGES